MTKDEILTMLLDVNKRLAEQGRIVDARLLGKKAALEKLLKQYD